MMKRACAVAIFIGLFGCATTSSPGSGPAGEVIQVEAPEPQGGGPAISLSPEQIQGFEAELDGQYRQLGLHYEEFDVLLSDADANQGSEAHRLHRKLKRRHLTLARLHEDRLAVGLGQREIDGDLAMLHRRAALWHEERFFDQGSGVEPADAELRSLRKALEQRRRVKP